MRIIKPSVTLLPPIPSTKESDLLKRIEECGRICYKSEDKITEGSCGKFVEGIIKRGHEAVLEHASIIVRTDSLGEFRYIHDLDRVMEEYIPAYISFLRFTELGYDATISGNVRAWRNFMKAAREFSSDLPASLEPILLYYPILFPEFQNARLFDRKGVRFSIIHHSELTDPLERLTHVDRTVLFICDRGVSHEIVRHRPAGYCQESTRYCNYASGKFGREITAIEPFYLKKDNTAYLDWAAACKEAETRYLRLLDAGYSPQEARAVLPNSLKTELMMTTNLSEWRHFLKLRCASGAHPQMREVACQLPERFHKEEPDLFNDIREELTE